MIDCDGSQRASGIRAAHCRPHSVGPRRLAAVNRGLVSHFDGLLARRRPGGGGLHGARFGIRAADSGRVRAGHRYQAAPEVRYRVNQDDRPGRAPHCQKIRRCDVFWNNEILHTLRLEKLGLLEPYRVPRRSRVPGHVSLAQGPMVRIRRPSPHPVGQHRSGAGLEHRPKSIQDLVDPRWHDRVGLAKPLFGTTATHAACLFVAWGDERAKEFFDGLKANAKIMGGNKQVAEAVASGRLAFGLTDTDDAMVEVEKGMPVQIIYPDQGADGLGTLFIPNTLSILAAHPIRKRPGSWSTICSLRKSKANWPPAPVLRFRSTRQSRSRPGSRRRPRSGRWKSISKPPATSGPR